MFSSEPISRLLQPNLLLLHHNICLRCWSRWLSHIRDFRSKCISIPFKHSSNGFFADGFIFHVIAAVVAIAVFAVLSTCKALAIKFETPWVFAVAVFFNLPHTAEWHCRSWKWRGKLNPRTLSYIWLRWTYFVL